MLELRNVSCGYNNSDVVNGITLKINTGQKVCIVGPNGCGKSTLLKAAAGIIGYKGDIILNGKNLKNMKRREIAQNCAFMTQTNKTYFDYTVYETVMLGRYAKADGSLFAKETQEDRNFVEQSLEAVNVDQLRDRKITELSGGERQRVFLAKTFAQDPKFIMLDEPTNHLDLKYQITLMEYLDKWVAKGGRSALVVLHDINIALGFADKILLMSKGRQVAYDSKENILRANLCAQVYEIDVRQHMLNSFAQWNV